MKRGADKGCRESTIEKTKTYYSRNVTGTAAYWKKTKNELKTIIF